jgi:hypothetical protein
MLNRLNRLWLTVYSVPQAALCEAAFDVLRSRFGANLECFASPLNCRCVILFHACALVDTPIVTCFFAAGPPFVRCTLIPIPRLEASEVFLILSHLLAVTRFASHQRLQTYSKTSNLI